MDMEGMNMFACLGVDSIQEVLGTTFFFSRFQKTKKPG